MLFLNYRPHTSAIMLAMTVMLSSILTASLVAVISFATTAAESAPVVRSSTGMPKSGKGTMRMARFSTVPTHAAAHHGNKNLIRRGMPSKGQGEMTYYDVGLGACEKVNSNSELVAALNHIDFGPSWPARSAAACFACVSLSCPDQPNKAPLKVQIVDKCPGCKSGDLDVSPVVFEHFFDKDKGRAKINWS
ncbi:RlpA-like double-psi beta-barrel-protein domain-containing protein-containing protein, partial [Catenaria anguillulae PL171]